ncbi:hypothetical protein [uncultured Hoeflea sp.]
MQKEIELIRDVSVCLKITQKMAERGSYAMLLYLIEMALLECEALARKAQ